CRDYATSHPKPGYEEFNPYPDVFELTKKYNAAIFLATASNSASFELPDRELERPPNPETCESLRPEDIGGGVFTYVLLRLLSDGSGRNNVVRLTKLADDLGEEVKKICAKQLVRWNPSQKAGDFQAIFGRR